MPSWFDLSTSDDAAAVQFYGALFGWQDDPRPMPEGGTYHMQQIDGDDAAAISLQQPDEAAQGIPPHWNVYITVDDVDAAAGKVEAAGGSVIAPPFDVLDAGRMAVITDPTGGAVCLWEAKESIGAERIREPGSPTWAELITPDPERAAKFFGDLLGVEVETTDMPGGETYTLLKVDGQEVAGVFKPGPELGDVPTAWTAYFEVADVDASAAQVPSLGGTVLNPPTDIPGGRFAMIADPQQAVVGIHTRSEGT
jgi:predicted enzyme related to lactoylglutathione lyase